MVEMSWHRTMARLLNYGLPQGSVPVPGQDHGMRVAGDRLSDGFDAGEDEVDAGQELLVVVMLTHLGRHPL